MAFEQVVTQDEQDTLRGKLIANGEKLIVRWPDASSTSHVAIVTETLTSKVRVKTIDGKRKRIELVRSEAHVFVKVRGVDLKVMLAGSGLFVARDE